MELAKYALFTVLFLIIIGVFLSFFLSRISFIIYKKADTVFFKKLSRRFFGFLVFLMFVFFVYFFFLSSWNF